MADFCAQCSVEMFGADEGDLKDLGDASTLEPGHGWAVICEGCGFIVVDNAGKCIASYCEKHGDTSPNNDTEKEG